MYICAQPKVTSFLVIIFSRKILVVLTIRFIVLCDHPVGSVKTQALPMMSGTHIC